MSEEQELTQECVVAYTDKDGQPTERAGDHKWIWDHSNGWFTHQRCQVCGSVRPVVRFQGQ
ncbi:60S ribosomal protein [Caudoviricetes sp.]|nr:60S ribosomal protein [Caudoviricetes sp.]